MVPETGHLRRTPKHAGVFWGSHWDTDKGYKNQNQKSK